MERGVDEVGEPPPAVAARDACLKVSLRTLLSHHKRKNRAEGHALSKEAARRMSEAALVADCIHRDVLTLINLYARDADENARPISHAWNMKVVMLFVYAVTGGDKATTMAQDSEETDDPAEAQVDEQTRTTAKGVALPAVNKVVKEVFTRLYEPIRRVAGMPVGSRTGISWQCAARDCEPHRRRHRHQHCAPLLEATGDAHSAT
jgi:hypothetical protein